jgi:phosphate starvation-inducible PhoH-like protein
MEAHIELYNIDEERLICGHHDRHARTLRSLYGVAFVSREGFLKIIGEEESVKQVKNLVHRILERHRRGDAVSDEDVARLIEEAQTRQRQRKHGTNRDQDLAVLPPHIRPKSKGQERYIECIAKNEISFGIGPAGTGKTFLAVAVAISELKEGLYRKLVLARPAVEAGEKLGFLPGDYQAKVNPYLRPLYDAIESFLDIGRFKKYIENDVIEIVPLAYMRGRNLDRAFIILDEAQNTTAKQMKMFLTRMGNGSKIVITGDITQIDLPGEMESGLIHCLRILKGIKGIGIVYMDERDIFRHPLVQRIVAAYDRVETKTPGRDGPKAEWRPGSTGTGT